MNQQTELIGTYNGARYMARHAENKRKIMHKHNIIGDIHGRDSWKNLVKDDCVNIFIGDYFDPYDHIPHNRLQQNFEAILAYKRQHPETVLLYGNHDMHYMVDCLCSSRYDQAYADTFRQAFEDSKRLFHGVAYSIEDQALVTHAGVTKEWYERQFGEYRGETPEQVAEKLNELWLRNKLAFEFDLSDPTDWCGDSPTQSPVWIRPDTLIDHNLFAGTPYKQIFGHTQMDDITPIGDSLVCVDCLGTTAKSYQL